MSGPVRLDGSQPIQNGGIGGVEGGRGSGLFGDIMSGILGVGGAVATASGSPTGANIINQAITALPGPPPAPGANIVGGGGAGGGTSPYGSAMQSPEATLQNMQMQSAQLMQFQFAMNNENTKVTMMTNAESARAKLLEAVTRNVGK